MTSADDNRVRKALQGMDFPADKDALVTYAAERDEDSRAIQALRALPNGEYVNVDEVAYAVPQSPAEHDPRQSPS